MEKFTVIDALTAARPGNVDTDAIIPKQFLKVDQTHRVRPNLFDEWRYADRRRADMDERPLSGRCLGLRCSTSHVIQGRRPADAENFGCVRRANMRRGRSRLRLQGDHRPSRLPHLLQQLLQNGILPIVLPAAEIDRSSAKWATPGYKREDRPAAQTGDPTTGQRAFRSRSTPRKALSAERAGRYRPDAASRRQDPRFRRKSAVQLTKSWLFARSGDLTRKLGNDPEKIRVREGAANRIERPDHGMGGIAGAQASRVLHRLALRRPEGKSRSRRLRRRRRRRSTAARNDAETRQKPMPYLFWRGRWPEVGHPAATSAPERGLLGIRKQLGLFANLRPAILYPRTGATRRRSNRRWWRAGHPDPCAG